MNHNPTTNMTAVSESLVKKTIAPPVKIDSTAAKNPFRYDPPFLYCHIDVSKTITPVISIIKPKPQKSGSTDKPGGVCFQQAGRAGGGFAQA